MRYSSIYTTTPTILRGPRGRIKSVLGAGAYQGVQRAKPAPTPGLKAIRLQPHLQRNVFNISNRLVS